MTLAGCIHDPATLHDDQARVLRMRDRGELVPAAEGARAIAVEAAAELRDARVRWTWDWMATWARRFEMRLRREAGDEGRAEAVEAAAAAADRPHEAREGWPTPAEDVARERLEGALASGAEPARIRYLVREADRRRGAGTIDFWTSVARASRAVGDPFVEQAALLQALQAPVPGDGEERPAGWPDDVDRREGPAWFDELARIREARELASSALERNFASIDRESLADTRDPVVPEIHAFLARELPPPSDPDRRQAVERLRELTRRAADLAWSRPTRLEYLRLALACRTRLFRPTDLEAVERLARQYREVHAWKDGRDADARREGRAGLDEVARVLRRARARCLQEAVRRPDPEVPHLDPWRLTGTVLEEGVAHADPAYRGALARVLVRAAAWLESAAVPDVGTPHRLERAVAAVARAEQLDPGSVPPVLAARLRGRRDDAWAREALGKVKTATAYSDPTRGDDVAVRRVLLRGARRAASRIGDEGVREHVLGRIRRVGGRRSPGGGGSP